MLLVYVSKGLFGGHVFLKVGIPEFFLDLWQNLTYPKTHHWATAARTYASPSGLEVFVSRGSFEEERND